VVVVEVDAADFNSRLNKMGVGRLYCGGYDMDFHKLTAVRQRYFRPGYRDKKWVADYNMRLGRRSNRNKKKRQLEDDWMQWMRTEGRARGYQDPVVFKGPPMAAALTRQVDIDTDPYTIRNRPEFASEQELTMGYHNCS